MNPLIIGSALGAGIGGGLVLIREDSPQHIVRSATCSKPRTHSRRANCRAHPGGNVHGLGSRPQRSRGQPDAGWTEQAYAGWTEQAYAGWTDEPDAGWTDEPDAGWTEGGSVPSR